MVERMAAACGLNDLKESCHSCLLRGYLNVRGRRLPVGAQLLVRMGPLPAQLANRRLDLGRRVRCRDRTLGVRRPWRQLRLRQALEEARLVGERRLV